MAEFITIAGENEPAVRARLELEKNARPGQRARVLRCDVVDECSLRRVPGPPELGGNDGDAFNPVAGAKLYALVVEFLD